MSAFLTPTIRALSARLLIPVLATVLTACSGGAGSSASPVASQAPSEPPAGAASPTAAAPAAFPVTVTDDEGTAVTIEAEPTRIVSLTPAETEILFALGAGDRVVGKVEDIANFPPEAASVPVVGSFDGVDVEKIVAAEPDVVFAGGSGGTPADAIDRLRSFDIPVVVVYASDFEGVLADIELTGTVVGRADEAADMSAGITETFEDVAAATAGAERPRVFYETGDQPSIYGIADDSVYAEMIELAGGDPITTGSAMSWEMPLETLITADPELIILGDAAYGVTPEAVAARPGWADLTAVKAGAIRPIDDIVVTRPGPRLGEGLRLLAEAIHPGLIDAGSPAPSGG